MKSSIKIIKTATVALSLDILLKGQLKFLNQYFNVIAVSGKDYNLDTVAKREGVKTIDVKMVRSINIFKDCISLVKLFLVFKKEKPTIVHSITPKAGLLTMTAGYFAGVPVRMHTFTGLIFPYKRGMFQKLLILMDKVLCKFATHIYPEGRGVMQDLIAFNITNKPLKVIANGNINGIDTDYFNPKKFTVDQNKNLKTALNIPIDSFVYIFVGRLVGDKGVNELVQSFLKIQNKRSNMVLLLVGPFENNINPLEYSTVEKIEQTKNIISVGFQKDVRPYLAISDIFVFPSYREGFPNVILQAGSMELPCIVTNVNGCNEIIEEGVNGLIIRKKNIDELKNAMLNLYNNRSLYQKLKANSRSIIKFHYKQEFVWNALLETYSSVAENV